MKKTIVILALLFLLALAAVDSEPAGRGRMDFGMMYGEPVSYGAVLTTDAGLDLTAAQLNQIRDLDEKYAQEMKSLQTQMYSKATALKTEWQQARPDQGKITALHRDVTRLRNLMREKMTSHRTAVLGILTPEQQAQMQDNAIGQSLYNKTGFGAVRDGKRTGAKRLPEMKTRIIKK